MAGIHMVHVHVGVSKGMQHTSGENASLVRASGIAVALRYVLHGTSGINDIADNDRRFQDKEAHSSRMHLHDREFGV